MTETTPDNPFAGGYRHSTRVAIYHYLELPSHTKRKVLQEIGLLENLSDDYDDMLIFKKIGEDNLQDKFKEIVERERACLNQ